MRYVIAVLTLFGAVAYAQTCIVLAPSSVPKATGAEIRFTNPDGGARPCEIAGVTPGGRPPKFYPVQGARCDVAKPMADQAVAKDNGWDDGGSP